MIKIDGVTVVTAASTEVFVENIAKSESRALPIIHNLPEWREGMPLALVGGGPSLADHIDELKRYEHVMLCGSVHDYAVGQGVEPRWAVCCDPDPIAAAYFQNPQKGCRYLIASACDDAVFKALEGYDVVLWHSGGFESSPEVWGESRKVLVGGGCTVGTRGFVLAICFGFSNLHLFGFDGCVRATGPHHAYDFADGDTSQIGDLNEVRMGATDGPAYLVAGYMMGQLFDFQRLLGIFGDRVTVAVHGEGPMNDLVKFMKAKKDGKED